MNLTEENIIGVKELNENENISLSDFVPVQKENETEIKKISLEKILLAVSKMTNEQKQILNSALALIDDENISSEKTFSSEKINSQIETVTTSKVAEIVANAPEDFNTLKEMSDWISEHQEDVTAMNSAILKNATDLATETTQRKSADEKLQSQTVYKTRKHFYGSRTGRYLKIGSIKVSSGMVSFANLTLIIFADNNVNNVYPVGTVQIGISSGSNANAFNINGFSTIPLNNTNSNSPRIVVEKTATDYILYVDCAYNYLGVTVEEHEVRSYTRSNFEESSSLSGTIVFNSTTDTQIKYLS